MILILGHPDENSEKVLAHLVNRNIPHQLWHSGQFPTNSQFGLNIQAHSPTSGRIKLDKATAPVPLESIQSVYWYYFHGIDISPWQPTADIDFREVEASLLTLFRCMTGSFWVNPPQAVAQHRFKPYQLQQIRALGLNTPNTLVTNDYDAMLQFIETCPNGIVTKNMTGIGIPRFYPTLDAFIDTHPKNTWTPFPWLLQECIRGIDTRIHVVGDACFASTIHTDDWTFVEDPNCQLRPTTLPDALLQNCLDICRVCGYVLSGVDLRQTEDGRFVFLEANPSPQFAAYEDACNYPISESIAHLLIRGDI